MNFTREQFLAQSTDRHLAVVANAGSGKTAVLVNRYLSLLLGGVDVREIVAITFTKKAASEMQKRVAEKLEVILADPEQQQRWGEVKRIRERLNSARISTIHSFCARLLRDFPIEADINPNFSELGEYEGFSLKRDATAFVLEERLLDDGERRAETLRVVRTFGRSVVETYMQDLLAEAETFQSIRQIYNSDTKVFLARIRKTFAEAIVRRARAVADVVSHLFAVVPPDAFSKAKVAREKFAEAQSTFGILEEAFANTAADTSWDELEHVLLLCDKLKELLCTKAGTLTAAIASSIDSPAVATDINTSLSAALRSLDGAVDICRNHALDEKLVEHARTLCTLAEEAYEWVEKEKARLGALDFDDLQIKASALLDNSDVAERLRRRIRYLMIDEFQDTNELQYSIARKLVAAIAAVEDSETDAQDSTNLFIVGDPKQSIYGFRGADVRVFDRAQKHIYSANEKALVAYLGDPAYTPDEYHGNVRLSASFRLLPVVAAFVNRVCGAAMNARQSEFDVAYEPLVCGRQSNEPDAGNGSITLLVAQKRRGENSTEDDDDTAEEALSEAELLARYIRAFVASDSPGFIWERSRSSSGEEARPARWGDIAVLARSRSGFDSLAAALRRNGVPFIIHSGTGYFDKQEILDMRSFLLFLSNPNDDLALAAILRSPFFGITDTELFNIGVCTGSSLWERFLAYYAAFSSTLCTPVLLRAQRILTDLLPLAPRLTIPSLIRMILSQTAWRGMVAGDERSEQMEANIEKLLSLAREFESKGFRNLFDFAEELHHLAHHSDSEGEAEVTVGRDAVQIMTVHASKGLEFPIVALYQSSTVNNRTPSFYADTELGACFKLPVDMGDGLPLFVETPLYWLAQQKAKEREQAERKRVLYVALTRAENHLVTTGTVSVTSKGEVTGVDGFFRAVVDALEIPYTDLRSNRTVEFTDPLMLLRDNERHEHKLRYEIAIRTAPPEVNFTETETKTAAFQMPPMLIDDVPFSIEGDMYSASQLQLFISDPYEYELVYRLGLPPSEDATDYDRSRLIPDDTPDISSTMPGTIIHSVLAALPTWLGSDGTTDEEELDALVDRKLREFDVPLTHPTAERIRREVRAVAANQFIAARAAVFAEARFEYPFHLYTGRDFLIGSVDALVPSLDGDVEIWDWKTNAIGSSFDMFRLFDRYRLQLEVYAYFLAKFRPEQQRITARLLFTRLADKASNEAGWIQSLTVERSDIDRIEMKILSIIDEVRRVSYGDRFAE